MFKINKIINKSEMDLTSGDTKTLIKKFIIFVIPILLVGILELLFNTFDLIIVQQKNGAIYGAAVGSNGSLVALITQFFLGLSSGLNVVVAKNVGKKDKEATSKCIHTGLLLSFISGIILSIFGFIFAKNLLILMKVDNSYLDIASNYLKIYFLSMPGIMIYNFGASAFKGMGDSFKPLVFLIISGIVNVLLNYLFVYTFDLKEVGVALGTVISQSLSAFLVLLSLYINKGFCNFRFKKLRFYKEELLDILRFGLPSGIEGILFSISNVLLQASVNEWPSMIVSANTNAGNIENYTYIAMYAVFNATPSFISSNYGRGFKDNVKKCHLISLILVSIIGIVLGSITYLLKEPLLKMYMGSSYNEDIAKYAFERMKVILFSYFLCGIMDTERGVLRGVGYSILPTIYTILFNCGFRVFWDLCIYSSDINSPYHSLGLLYLCYPISWILSFLVSIITYFILRKKWMKKCDDNLIEFNKRNLENNINNN